MNLYLVTPIESQDEYDYFEHLVVAATSAGDARRTHPSDAPISQWELHSQWVSRPSNALATKIGTAEPGTYAGIVCSSYNSSY